MGGSVLKNQKLKKVDCIIFKIVHFCSYISGITLAVMAIWATVNVIYSKITMNSIPSTTDWIAYLLVPTVFLAIGVEVLDSGLISVDLITEKFPAAVQKTIIAVGYLVGAALSAIMCQQQAINMRILFQSKKMSSVDKLSFRVWPFSMVMTVGLALMTFTLIWYVVRMFAEKEQCIESEDPEGRKEQAVEKGVEP